MFQNSACYCSQIGQQTIIDLANQGTLPNFKNVYLGNTKEDVYKLLGEPIDTVPLYDGRSEFTYYSGYYDSPKNVVRFSPLGKVIMLGAYYPWFPYDRDKIDLSSSQLKFYLIGEFIFAELESV